MPLLKKKTWLSHNNSSNRSGSNFNSEFNMKIRNKYELADRQMFARLQRKKFS